MKLRSGEEWGKLVDEYQASQESVSDFCKRHQISKSTFYYWLVKNDDKKKKNTSIKMLPVVSSEVKSVDAVELLLSSGMSLRFSANASPRYVVAIVRALV